MKNKSVIVIGLDGATWRVLQPLIDKGKLPFLKKLIQDGWQATLKSTIPPLTGSSWVSLQTGTNPGQHGIFDFKKRDGKLVNSQDVKLPRIWEVLNKRGLRSCVVNMPVTYPIRPLNGYLISSFLTPRDQDFTFPKELTKKLRKWNYQIDLDNSFLPEDVPATKTTFKSIRQLAKKRLEISSKLLQEEAWNFFFVLVKATDLMQHYDWNGPETTKLYQLIDKQLEKLITKFEAKYPSQELSVIVLSDHGFHPSAHQDVALYPLLRSLEIIPKQPRWWLKLARGWRRLNQRTSKSGLITTYGMFVSDQKLRGEIVEKLKSIKIKGKSVFQEVVLAEDLYGPNYASEIPDILWLMNEEWAPNADPLADQLTYPKKTVLKGHHYADRNGVLIIKSPRLKKKQNLKQEINIFEIGNLITDLLTTPAQTMQAHHFYLKKQHFPVEVKTQQAQKFIKQMLRKYKNPAIAWTGGKDSTVLLHLVRSVTNKKLPIMFIDHQNHFEETLKFVKRLNEEWQLNLITVGNKEAIAAYKKERDVAKRKELARIVKIKSIAEAIERYKWDSLFVGIRWDEHPARSQEKSVSKRENHDRLHPILNFTERDIWDYIYLYKVPYNPLYDQGYRSVGEKEFTRPVWQKGASERAGREKEKEEIMEKLRKLGYF